MIKISLSPKKATLRHSLKRLITVGRSYELLGQDLIEHLRILQERISFDYTRFHTIFRDEMQVYTEECTCDTLNDLLSLRHPTSP